MSFTTREVEESLGCHLALRVRDFRRNCSDFLNNFLIIEAATIFKHTCIS